MSVFTDVESEVRSYCRTFDTVFDQAKGSTMHNQEGQEFLDFFAGAGSLNYGHNHPDLKRKLIEYLERDGVFHSLDMHTAAKAAFLERFKAVILEPRHLDYKVMFPGPTGTNAVESALKLARKVTGRTQIATFTNGFHGMTLGSLALTGNSGKRAGAGIPLSHSSFLPFDGYLGDDVNTLDVIRKYLEDPSSGLDKPAAFILETIQAEGGVNVASPEWLRGLADLAKQHDILLIVDDIQVGCGRTGTFFSFEKAGIKPDMVTLSKSLSGYGLPFAITMFRADLDVWDPGEHNGTFRGNNAAFVTATEALKFWENEQLTEHVLANGAFIQAALQDMAQKFPETPFQLRGRGLIWGLDFGKNSIAGDISKAAFKHGLIIETSGPWDNVLKLLPALTIEQDQLAKGLSIIETCLAEVTADSKVSS